jgi:AAA domain
VIPNRTEQLEKLHLEHVVRPAESQKTNGHLHGAGAIPSDEEVLALCRKARNAPKFERLYDRGDLSDYEGDDSRADQALVSMLAFYTQDPEQLDSLFRGSALHRPEKWGKRADYRRRTIEKALGNLAETYGSKAVTHNGTNGHGSSSSQRPNLHRSRTLGRKPAVLRLAEVERPGPRRYRWADLVPFAYPTLIFGAGGVAKSLLALALAAMLALGRGWWLGRALEGGPVLYLDFELDAEEMARRVWQVCEGAGFAEPPGDLFYLSAAGYKVEEAFEVALEACRELGIVLIVVDSLGPALQGDAEAARDTIGFFSRYVDPFKAAGVTPLIIDHQSKVQAGQSYQGKEAFGSVYKTNLARSVIQVEATERAEGTLTVRLRQKKHNFGPLAAPFGVKLTYTEEAVTIEAVELGAAELAEEATLTAPERVKLALADGPKYPWEIAEATGVRLKTVGNTLTGLRKQGVVEATGEKEGRAEQVRLIVPTSQPYRDRTWDDGDPSADLYVNERGEAEF